MQRVVITGATGMIGINLIKYFLDQNMKILAISREVKRLEKVFPQNENLKTIECEMKDIENLEIFDQNYDVFYHLAWEGTRGQDRDIVDSQLRSIDYTIKALKVSKKLGCKKFIGIGSQAEYGRIEGKMGPDTLTKPDTAYGITKLCAGELSRVLANQIGIEHIWARIISAYGPYDYENTMIMASIREMIENGKSLEYTKAEQMWDYIYVEDIARALYLIGEKGKNNSIYCIGSGMQMPLHKYIEEIRNQIDKNIDLKIGAKQYKENEVMNICADITNLTEDTGFVPKIGFEEGITRTIEYYKKSIIK